MLNMHGNSKTIEEFFLGPKVVKELLGDNFIVTDNIKSMLTEFFEYFPDKDRSAVWRKNIAIWLLYGLDNWIQRRLKLNNVTSNSLEFFELMYGNEGKKKYLDFKATVSCRMPSTLEYWKGLGFSETDAKIKVQESQQAKAKKAAKKLSGTSEFTVRSKDFWIKHGYSDEEASEKIKMLQRRDEAFYIERYGITKGIKRFNESKEKRKNTWKSKDKRKHALSTRPGSYNPHGQEIQAIRGFLSANNISESYCKFGSPKDQFYQWIPSVGYRRYDLAVFDDVEHTKLKYILEYHGPGHIRFSEFSEELRNEPISVGGKKLLHLGTYGAAFDNDTAKRNHIMTHYPGVLYLVMWTDDLTNKRFKINELL